MGIKETGRKIVIGVATAGMSTCGGCSDPAPAAIACSRVGDGEGITVETHFNDTFQLVVILGAPNDRSDGYQQTEWTQVTISDLSGAQLVSQPRINSGGQPALQGDTATFALRLDSPGDGGTPDGSANEANNGSGSFTVRGILRGNLQGGTCAVKRTFQFQVTAGKIMITELLPLRARQEAVIAMLKHAGGEVHLEARSPFSGARQAEWTVFAGELSDRRSERTVWRLPSEPGLYRVELLMDYGDDGFALDAMSFEVS